MGKQINQYTKVRTNLTLVVDDLMDLDSTDDFGSTYESAKMTIGNLLAYLNGNINNLYNGDGTLLGDRTVTAGIPFQPVTFWTKWLGGDVIVECDDELFDRAFLVQNSSQQEVVRLGYDIGTLSGELEITTIGGFGPFLVARANELFVNNFVLYVGANVGAGTINPLEKFHCTEKIRADQEFNINGVDGIGGIAGTVYTFGGGLSGDVLDMTISGGIVTAINLVP